MKFEEIAPALGAEITGVDLASPLSELVRSTILQTFHERLVLVFRDQNLTPQQQVRFAREFGVVVPYPFINGLAECPEVIEVLTRADATVNFGGGWHSDTPYLEKPSLGSLLYAKELPPVGGDTLFANLYRTYEGLDAETQDLLKGRAAHHSASKRYKRPGDRSTLYGASSDKRTSVTSDSHHPVLRRHPATDKLALYVSSLHTVGIDGIDPAESEKLLERLFAAQIQPDRLCRVVWRAGTLTIWDNRCTLHNALFDYAGYTRRMHRVSVEGERPI